MKVQIWSSFSCNNSSDYRLVARFRDPTVAMRMGKELAAFFETYAKEFDAYCEEHGSVPEEEPLPSAAALAAKHGSEWNAEDILSWGDEGLSYGTPDVEVIGGVLAIYHDYCGGFTDNIVGVLEGAGAEVEPEESAPPDISAHFLLPDGEAGERMASELAAFFNQKNVKEYMSDFAEPPWGDVRLDGEPESIVWYREGQRFAFKMPFALSGMDELKAYLANVRELDLRLCDELELAAFDMRDTLLELDARIASGTPITELELGGRRLRFIPPRVFELAGLEKLVLHDNPLHTLPPEIAKLSALEELDVSSCELGALPDELARLRKLRSLTISDNPLRVLPATVMQLPSLTELRANGMTGIDLSALALAIGLEVLDLGFLRAGEDADDDEEDEDDEDEDEDEDDDEEEDEDEEDEDEANNAATDDVPAGLVAFPAQILALRKLRELNLSHAGLFGIPDAIAELRELETLRINSVLGHNDHLPPLHDLPKLTTLMMDGNAGNTGKYPPHSVLDGVWKITTLQHLGVDRYGAEKGSRDKLEKLPDDAFARMPHLKTLDLSLNELVTLPASFFALAELESVDLQYTKLDRATLDKLRTTFPRVKIDLRNVETRHDVDDPHWKAVHAKVKAGAERLQRSDRAKALAELEEALAMCTPGSLYADYDELYAEYGCVDALGHLRVAAKGAEREALGDRLIAHATRALELVPQPGTIWHFTNEGAFQEEVTRRAGNSLAWMLMERGNHDHALSVADRALSVGGTNGYIHDTKVRILLAAGRPNDAYAIVEPILAEDPSFKDFQDIKTSPAYLAWLGSKQRGA